MTSRMEHIRAAGLLMVISVGVTALMLAWAIAFIYLTARHQDVGLCGFLLVSAVFIGFFIAKFR
jgi:hypothetical protein